jgi:hypothetical protein
LKSVNVAVETMLSAFPTLLSTPSDTDQPRFGSRQPARPDAAIKDCAAPQVGVPVRASVGARLPAKAIRSPDGDVVQPSSAPPLSVA